MDRDWKLLGQTVARRRAELGLSQVEVAHRGPLSLDRVQAIEGAKKSGYRLGTLAALERALEWEAGSIEAVLDGGQPTPIRQPSPVTAADRTERLLAENERMIRLLNDLSERERRAVEALIQTLRTSDTPEREDGPVT